MRTQNPYDNRLGSSDEHVEYVFWLTRPPNSTAPLDLTCCRISNASIVIDAPVPITIELAAIRACTIEGFGSAGTYIVRAKLAVAGWSSPLYMRLANPLIPHIPLYRTAAETEAFVMVIHALLAGSHPNVEPNPYLREYASRRAQPPTDIVFHPQVSPLEYYRILHPPLSPRAVIVRVIATVSFLVFLVIGSLYLIAGPPPLP
jgi:hypothetical protein